MTDIFFTDPSEIPLPPDEVRIRELRADPWPDGRRVRVYLEVDPSQVRPNADLTITDKAGKEAATASIIESMHRKMEVTMHLRGAQPAETYTLNATLFFVEIEREPGSEMELQPIERLVTDTAQTHFTLPANESLDV